MQRLDKNLQEYYLAFLESVCLWKKIGRVGRRRQNA